VKVSQSRLLKDEQYHTHCRMARMKS
jgi:hypothetical protein